MINTLVALIAATLINYGLPTDKRAVALISETIAIESDFGRYRSSFSGERAYGIGQMQARTAEDIINNFVRYRPWLQLIVNPWLESGKEISELLMDDEFNIIMIRIHYLRVKAPIPSTRELRSHYYKKYYNTYLGKSKVETYMRKAKKYIN